MARLQALERSKIGADGMMKIDEITQMESQGDLKEILNQWQKSAEKGVKEGWFELGELGARSVLLNANPSDPLILLQNPRSTPSNWNSYS